MRCLLIASFIEAAPVVFKAEARDADLAIVYSSSNSRACSFFGTKRVLPIALAFKRCSLDRNIPGRSANKREVCSDNVLNFCIRVQIRCGHVLDLVADLLEDVVQRGRVRRGEIVPGLGIRCVGSSNTGRRRIVRGDQMHEAVGVFGLVCVAGRDLVGSQ